MKIDKWDGAAVKNSLDDAAKKASEVYFCVRGLIETCLMYVWFTVITFLLLGAD